MYTSNLPIIFLLLLVGHRTISNTLELDTAQDVEKTNYRKQNCR